MVRLVAENLLGVLELDQRLVLLAVYAGRREQRLAVVRVGNLNRDIRIITIY